MQRRIIKVSPRKAANLLDKDLTTMYRWLADKKIAAHKDGSYWKVFLVEVSQENAQPMHFTLPYAQLESIVGELLVGKE